MHFLLIEYSRTVFLSEGWALVELKLGSKICTPSELEFKRPPVEPIGAKKIETSMHEGLYCVDPVHKHFPLMQAPFLLQ